ncbi:MAG TPA: ABC transporter permease, partial [Deinococcales bacterium]|nr:ABC transporter permease [Deinococcales bacterium]
MRWNFVSSVAFKEILSTFRDRRTLASTIVMPMILIPLLLIGLPLIMAKAFGGQQETRQDIGIVGLQYAPKALVNALEADTPGAKGVNLKPVTDPVKAVQDGKVEAVIVVPANVPSVAGGTPVPVKVYTKMSSTKSSLVLA